LRERTIYGNRDDVGTEFLILVEQASDFAKFVGASAGESERHEENHGLTFSNITTEADVMEARLGLLFEGNFWEGEADFEWHRSIGLG